jgi:hypothetical protein
MSRARIDQVNRRTAMVQSPFASAQYRVRATIERDDACVRVDAVTARR